MSQPGRFHAQHCPKAGKPWAVCRCIAGQTGLARRSEGMAYTGGDSTRAAQRRLKQVQREAAKAKDW